MNTNKLEGKNNKIDFSDDSDEEGEKPEIKKRHNEESDTESDTSMENISRQIEIEGINIDGSQQSINEINKFIQKNHEVLKATSIDKHTPVISKDFLNKKRKKSINN